MPSGWEAAAAPALLPRLLRLRLLLTDRKLRKARTTLRRARVAPSTRQHSGAELYGLLPCTPLQLTDRGTQQLQQQKQGKHRPTKPPRHESAQEDDDE